MRERKDRLGLALRVGMESVRLDVALAFASVRGRELDAIIVWRLDRWGRSLADLIVSLKELAELGIGFVSLTEAFDMTTPSGRALAGMLAVFAEFERDILRERVKTGIAQARAKGVILGRPKSAAKQIAEVRGLYRKDKLTKSEIVRRLGIGRTLCPSAPGGYLNYAKSRMAHFCANRCLTPNNLLSLHS